MCIFINKRLVPDEYYEHIGDIDLEKLYAAGKRVLLVDRDNTIAAYKAPYVPWEQAEWVRAAQRTGFEVCVVSNTVHEERLEPITNALSIRAYGHARKPSPKGYLSALKQLGFSPEQAAVIGDQLFTDVLGGNRAGIYTVWVEPFSKREFIGTKLNRLRERLVRKRILILVSNKISESKK